MIKDPKNLINGVGFVCNINKDHIAMAKDRNVVD